MNIRLTGNIPPLTRTIRIRRTRFVGQCYHGEEEIIKDILFWTPNHGTGKLRPPYNGRPRKTYVKELCEELNTAMKNRTTWN